MKNYTITVNGNVYDVTVEENGAGAPAAAPVAAPRAAAPAAPAAAPKAAAGAGSIQVKLEQQVKYSRFLHLLDRR